MRKVQEKLLDLKLRKFISPRSFLTGGFFCGKNYISSKKKPGHPIGVSFFMPKPLPLADQFYHVASSEAMQKAFIKIADDLDDERRTQILAIYNDDKLASAYRAMRNFNSLNKNGMTDERNMREVVRLHPIIYKFLQDIFEPHYGEKWLQNKKVLRHELVRPWWIVPKI